MSASFPARPEPDDQDVHQTGSTSNVEPEGVLIDVAESAEDDSGRLVPLADKRSIRRVILQPTIFDDL